MAIAYGSNATLLLRRESVYGQQPAGNYFRLFVEECETPYTSPIRRTIILGSA